MYALAIRSGIPAREWLDDPDPRAIPTALDLLASEGDDRPGRKEVVSLSK